MLARKLKNYHIMNQAKPAQWFSNIFQIVHCSFKPSLILQKSIVAIIKILNYKNNSKFSTTLEGKAQLLTFFK